jgi:hypothetical protein
MMTIERRRTNQFRCRPAALAGIAAVATGAALALACRVAAGAPAADTLTATVRAFDSRAGTLELLTGVGHALRIRRVHLPPALGISQGRTRQTVTALTPGCVVRVECRTTAGGTVASTVELIRTPAAERKP